ncbi:hypothetical protein [Sinorhizobium fredii]|nr:hypothetical protein [Sinorhizobium fredii]
MELSPRSPDSRDTDAAHKAQPVICYASIAAWAYAGARLRHCLDDAGRVRAFNRAMAALIALSAVYLAFEG